LKTYNNSYLFTLNVYSNSYYTWFKFIKDEFNLPLTIENDFEECFLLQRESGIYSAIFSEMVCIVSKYPKKVNRNLNNDLHSTSGIAIDWGYSSELTNFNSYYINGRNIPTELFNSVLNKKYTFEEFCLENNEDIKGGVIAIIKENFGNEELVKFLNAEVIDTKVFNHLSGHKETQKLWRTKNVINCLVNDKGEQGEYMSWYEITCPSTGTVYMLDTLPTFKKVDECAKFHRPSQIPKELEYNFTQFNN